MHQEDYTHIHNKVWPSSVCRYRDKWWLKKKESTVEDLKDSSQKALRLLFKPPNTGYRKSYII